jgi:hypothetical protein
MRTNSSDCDHSYSIVSPSRLDLPLGCRPRHLGQIHRLVLFYGYLCRRFFGIRRCLARLSVKHPARHINSWAYHLPFHLTFCGGPCSKQSGLRFCSFETGGHLLLRCPYRNRRLSLLHWQDAVLCQTKP